MEVRLAVLEQRNPLRQGWLADPSTDLHFHQRGRPIDSQFDQREKLSFDVFDRLSNYLLKSDSRGAIAIRHDRRIADVNRGDQRGKLILQRPNINAAISKLLIALPKVGNVLTEIEPP